MGIAKRVRKGVKIVAPLLALAHEGEEPAPTHGDLAIVAGAPARTEQLRDLLGDPRGTATGASLVVAAPGADVDEVADALARRREHGGRALAVLVGRPSERARSQSQLVAGHRLEVSDMVHVASLEGPGGRTVLDAVARELDDGAVAAARRIPALRMGVARRLVRDSARRAALVGALPLAGADLPALAVLQIRMVSRMAAAYDRPMGPERVLEAMAIVGAGFGWRAVGRTTAGLVPGVGWAAGGAVAYVGTRAIGEAALARLAAGHDLIDAGPLDKVRPQFDRLLDRFPRG